MKGLNNIFCQSGVGLFYTRKTRKINSFIIHQLSLLPFWNDHPIIMNNKTLLSLLLFLTFHFFPAHLFSFLLLQVIPNIFFSENKPRMWNLFIIQLNSNSFPLIYSQTRARAKGSSDGRLYFFFFDDNLT